MCGKCKNVAAADNQCHANNDSRQITGTFVIYSNLYVVSNVIGCALQTLHIQYSLLSTLTVNRLVIHYLDRNS